MASLQGLTVNSPGSSANGFVVAKGTTAQEPGSPAIGYLRIDTTLGTFSVYIKDVNISESPTASFKQLGTLNRPIIS
jgi:hypothetical protein